MRLFISLVALLLMFPALDAVAGKREMEEKIKGTWIVDEKASIQHYRTSKKAENKSERELNGSIQKMRTFIRKANLEFRFMPFFLAVTNQGSVTKHSLKTKMAAGQVIVLSSSQKSQRTHKTIEFRVTFLNDNQITIDSSDSKDLNLYVWKRIPDKK